MRYFAELSYKGTHYFGWQRQAAQLSVQQVIEESLYTALRLPIQVTGCGRTDTGVHARQYFLHFDMDQKLPEGFLRRINRLLPDDIAIHRFLPVSVEAHARYDATQRSYTYHLVCHKAPFKIETAYHFPFCKTLNIKELQKAAQLLLDYEDFYPFCKSNSDVQHTRCDLADCRWAINEEQETMDFHISANRFLRGMVRLVVGMCLNVGLGKTKIEAVQRALEKRERLPQSWSVPPQGLFLQKVTYGTLFKEHSPPDTKGTAP